MGFWAFVALIVIGAGTSYVVAEQQQKSAAKEAKKQRRRIEQRELEAGEYFEELNRQQMELQSQAHQMKLLTDIITTEQEQDRTRILQLPAAKTFSPAERINQAIDDFVRG